MPPAGGRCAHIFGPKTSVRAPPGIFYDNSVPHASLIDAYHVGDDFMLGVNRGAVCLSLLRAYSRSPGQLRKAATAQTRKTAGRIPQHAAMAAQAGQRPRTRWQSLQGVPCIRPADVLRPLGPSHRAAGRSLGPEAGRKQPCHPVRLSPRAGRSGKTAAGYAARAGCGAAVTIPPASGRRLF